MKQSPNGARGYFLVSMEGIPYWAEANFNINLSEIKNNNIKASLLQLDSQGKIIYE